MTTNYKRHMPDATAYAACCTKVDVRCNESLLHWSTQSTGRHQYTHCPQGIEVCGLICGGMLQVIQPKSPIVFLQIEPPFKATAASCHAREHKIVQGELKFASLKKYYFSYYNYYHHMQLKTEIVEYRIIHGIQSTQYFSVIAIKITTLAQPVHSATQQVISHHYPCNSCHNICHWYDNWKQIQTGFGQTRNENQTVWSHMLYTGIQATTDTGERA